jgi:hypothetical protein
MHTQTHNFTILDFVYRKISYNGLILRYTKSSIVKLCVCVCIKYVHIILHYLINIILVIRIAFHRIIQQIGNISGTSII